MLSSFALLLLISVVHCLSGTAIATNATNSSSTTTTTTTTTAATTTTRPSSSPSTFPSLSPSTIPTISPTKQPTTANIVYNYTTTIGPDIEATKQLEVNYTLNFSTERITTVSSVNHSLNIAYGLIGIPVNYVHNIIHVQYIKQSQYVCKIFSSIDAKDKQMAIGYEQQINSDPDDSSSRLATYLKQTLHANANSFDISVPVVDIVDADGNKDSHSDDTASIIIWFLGVSAVCALGALLLIICWRKFSAKDDNETENENAINLEFLLADPAATMHINNSTTKNAEELREEEEVNDGGDQKEEADDEDDEEEEEEEEERVYEAPNLDRI